ncbi:MAG TPA: AAA family ATPase [Symbiobacteriaceae bacterium]|nr:AAA family ATPase [Symbiobacteriaceae bacterium]
MRELRVENIKCFPGAALTFPSDSQGGSWCVLLGENGTGKSTLLQAIALSLLSRSSWTRLLEHPEKWVRSGAPRGRVLARYEPVEAEVTDPFSVVFEVRTPSADTDLSDEEEVLSYPTPTFIQRIDVRRPGSPPFLTVGYGAFRRMESEKAQESASSRRDLAFQTLFSDEAGLHGLSDWLLRMDYLSKDMVATKSPKERERLRNRLQAIIEVVNSLLPQDAPFRLSGVSANGLCFDSGGGVPLSLGSMSDGYRTMFALAADILRHVVIQNPLMSIDRVLKHDQDGRILVDIPGIVLIDEVDAHLHPKWQQEIGSYLRRTFPRVQFIVASHSPFVAQAATEGGLYSLRRADDASSVVVEPLRSVQGMAAEEILLSPAFGLETTRDPETETLLAEHSRLRALRARRPLAADEEARLVELSQRLESVLALEQAYARSVLEQIRKGPAQ